MLSMRRRRFRKCSASLWRIGPAAISSSWSIPRSVGSSKNFSMERRPKQARSRRRGRACSTKTGPVPFPAGCFTKIEAGKLTTDAIEFNLRDCLADPLKPFAVRAHKKNLELAYHVRTAVPDALIGDSGRLRQVLVNLVGNALKFTEKGEVVVKV